MRAESERSETERTLSLEGLWELFGRHTRLVLVTLGVFLVGSLVVVAVREPSYRARASLILDDKSGDSGILGELAMLGQAPQAASQIEILKARSTADETVRSSSATAAAEEREQHLGLATLVEDPLLGPLQELAFSKEPRGKLPPRLRASLECADEFDSLRELAVEFLAPTRVHVRERKLLSDHEPLDADLDGDRVEFGGCTLHLWPEGDLTGRSFEVRRLTREDAIERVMQATRVRETERNSSVIELTYDDSDPRRAAETANALCLNYLARNEARGDRRASQTVKFIQDSLASQTKSLHDAENEVVRLQRENPRAIDITKSGEALITQLSGLEVQRMQLELSAVSTRQALELLRAGDTTALSRLTVELGDPITATYLESLAKLSAESAAQSRSDAGAFKLLLQQRAAELETQLETTELEIADLGRALEALAKGDFESVLRLGGGPPSARDPFLESYLGTLADLQARKTLFARELTPEHPDVQRNEQRLTDSYERVRVLITERRDARVEQREELRRLVASYRERNDAFPADERRHIDEALDGLRARTATHLESRLRGIELSSSSIAAETARVEQSLGELPEEERRVAEPMRKLSAHTEIVKLLLAKEQEAQITKASTLAGAEFIDFAVPPSERSGPSIPLHLFFGVVLGIVAALGLAFATEAFARRVFTAAELELATNLSVLGTIPDFRRGRYKVRKAGDHFVPLRDDAEGATADAYRSLRASLKYLLSDGSSIRTLAATSCIEGEGKSSTNVALAMTFARSGRRVLLIDCDMRRPSVDKYLQLQLTPGLSEVLEGKLPWREAVQHNACDRLDVITAGIQPASPSDLLDGEEFTHLLAKLRAEYDLVVCDVPPALAVSDIESCAARLDALVLVVRSNRVATRIVTETTQRLRKAGAKLIGAVLNGVGTSIANGKYGHGYGYGNSDEHDRKRRAG